MPWRWRVEIELEDTYEDEDREILEATLLELAELVREDESPPTGEIWSRSGMLLCRARTVEILDGDAKAARDLRAEAGRRRKAAHASGVAAERIALMGQALDLEGRASVLEHADDEAVHDA